jgi:hypothetical protein
MKEILTKTAAFILSIPLIFNNIIINLVFNPIESFKNQRFKRKNFDFLRKNNGRNFFCYKNKESAEIFIQKNIEPYLSKRITFVNLNNPESVSEIDSRIFKILKKNDKFPCLVKFRDDNVFQKPMYNEFYKALFITKSHEELVDEIIDFFELKKLEIFP